MPWQDPSFLPFSKVEISAHVPAAGGVYGLLDGETCVFVGESWNLRARLLELANVVANGSLTAVYELCPDDTRDERKRVLSDELVIPYAPPQSNSNSLFSVLS